MNVHDATEEAYKNGYEQGVKDFAEKIKNYYNHLNCRTPATLVSFHVEEILKNVLGEICEH